MYAMQAAPQLRPRCEPPYDALPSSPTPSWAVGFSPGEAEVRRALCVREAFEGTPEPDDDRIILRHTGIRGVSAQERNIDLGSATHQLFELLIGAQDEALKGHNRA